MGGGMTETFSVFFAASALFLSLRPRPRAFLSGAMVALAIACSLEAIILVPIVCAALIWPKKDSPQKRSLFERYLEPLLWPLAGGLICGLALASPFLIFNAAPATLDSLIHYDALYRASSIAPDLVAYIAVLGVLFGLPWMLPLVFGAVLLLMRFARGQRSRWGLTALGGLSLAWFGLSLLWIVFGERLYSHYDLFLVSPAALFFVALLIRLERAALRRSSLLIIKALLISGVLAGLGLQFVMTQNGYIRKAGESASVVVYIDTHSNPDDLIYVWGHEPQLYWQSGREPAGRYFYLLPLMTPGYAQTAITETLSSWQTRPPVIIVDASNQPGQAKLAPLLTPHEIQQEDMRNLTTELEPLRDFVRAHYTYIGTFSGHPIYQWSH